MIHPFSFERRAFSYHKEVPDHENHPAASFAGSWYPASATACEKEIQAF
ncbi:MAG: hypothetical protein R2874_02180 [Desulfobacterales bacterium]